MNRLLNDYIKYWAANNMKVDLGVLGGIYDDPITAQNILD